VNSLFHTFFLSFWFVEPARQAFASFRFAAPTAFSFCLTIREDHSSQESFLDAARTVTGVGRRFLLE
jgi:hypothetical protein